MSLIPLVSMLGLLAGDFAAAESKLSVAVSLPPYAWLLERIGGEHVQIIQLVEEGEDPHSFQPSPRRVTALANAAVWFTTGMPFEEPLADKLATSAPRLLVVPVHEGIDLEAWEEHEHEHAHGKKEGDGGTAEPKKVETGKGKADHEHEHEHDHGDFDPHVWLSPLLLKTQAHTVAHTLAELVPDHGERFEENAVALEAELDALHASLTEILAPMKGSTVYVFHPAFGYFARTYGMTQESIELRGREPSAKYLTDLITRAKADGVKAIFVQPQFSQASAEKMARSIGAAVVPVNPLQKDVLANLRTLGEAIRASR